MSNLTTNQLLSRFEDQIAQQIPGHRFPSPHSKRKIGPTALEQAKTYASTLLRAQDPEAVNTIITHIAREHSADLETVDAVYLLIKNYGHSPRLFKPRKITPQYIHDLHTLVNGQKPRKRI